MPPGWASLSQVRPAMPVDAGAWAAADVCRRTTWWAQLRRDVRRPTRVKACVRQPTCSLRDEGNDTCVRLAHDVRTWLAGTVFACASSVTPRSIVAADPRVTPIPLATSPDLELGRPRNGTGARPQAAPDRQTRRSSPPMPVCRWLRGRTCRRRDVPVRHSRTHVGGPQRGARPVHE